MLADETVVSFLIHYAYSNLTLSLCPNSWVQYRIRRWACIPEMDNRALRVILLEDGETIHNAFLTETLRSKVCE